MTDLRGGFTPEVESDSANSTIFKTVAALIVALMLGVVGAYYYFGPSMTAPATRVALVTPPAVPMKPVIPPQMVAPLPQASVAPTTPTTPTTEAKAAETVAPPSAAPHPRHHVQQAEVQPAPAAPATAEPTASPALTAPTPPPLEAPVQPAADPTQSAQ